MRNQNNQLRRRRFSLHHTARPSEWPVRAGGKMVYPGIDRLERSNLSLWQSQTRLDGRAPTFGSGESKVNERIIWRHVCRRALPLYRAGMKQTPPRRKVSLKSRPRDRNLARLYQELCTLRQKVRILANKSRAATTPSL